MNPRFLETFIQVAELRSFSQAAERLHTTQANVSARISALERELDMRLFVRGCREIHLTPQGILALDQARDVMKSLNSFREQLGGKMDFRGTVRIGVSDSVSRTLLQQFVEDLKSRCPRITLELIGDSSRSLTQKLLDGRIHLGFLMGPVVGHDIVNLDLINLACAWVAGPRFGLADEPIDVTSLASYPIVSFSTDSIPFNIMRGYFRREVFQSISFTSSTSIATIINLVMRGMGVAVLPRVIIEEDIANGSLRLVNVVQSFPFLPFHVAYRESPDDPLTSMVAKTACDAAKKYCASQNPAYAW